MRVRLDLDPALRGVERRFGVLEVLFVLVERRAALRVERLAERLNVRLLLADLGDHAPAPLAHLLFRPLRALDQVTTIGIRRGQLLKTVLDVALVVLEIFLQLFNCHEDLVSVIEHSHDVGTLPACAIRVPPGFFSTHIVDELHVELLRKHLVDIADARLEIARRGFFRVFLLCLLIARSAVTTAFFRGLHSLSSHFRATSSR